MALMWPMGMAIPAKHVPGPNGERESTAPEKNLDSRLRGSDGLGSLFSWLLCGLGLAFGTRRALRGRNG